MSEDSAPPAALPNEQNDLLTQLVAGPSIREVATQALLPALKTLYPQLTIDPRLAMVVTPTWAFDATQVIPGARRYESLTGALVRHGVASTPVLYFDGEHYLTLEPLAPVPVQLPVNIEAIGRLLNELAPLLFIAFQEQQLNYWNQLTRPSTPRWKQLSHSLRERWNIEPGPSWDADQVAMARHLFTYPEKGARTTNDRYQSRACLIDLDQVDDGAARHLNTLDMAVLTGTLGTRTLILTYTITGGFQSYESMQALGESLLSYTAENDAGNAWQWRLIEPEGNYFDHLACNLIALQADAIGALATDTDIRNRDLAPHISRAADGHDPTDRQAPSRFNRVEQGLPDWMLNASSVDLTAYSRHLMDLATLRTQNANQSFQDGIKPIREYTLERLREAMLKQHPEAADLDLADIEIVVDSVVVWGTFVPPTEPQRSTLSLVDLALQNLIAVPLGDKTVRSKSASTLPSWMNAAYLEALIVSVDIGRTYPALIKGKLLDDPLESLRRQNLFTGHLRVELPLLALQQKIRGLGGINELGYRYVAAVVQVLDANRRVDGQEIVIRPLAFNPGWRLLASADEVANMFVIGPRQMDKGPCLLYQPLLDQSLSQYPTPANLIYAIKHSAALRQSVLAWLPDRVRSHYSDYVFTGSLRSVWSLSQLLADPLTPLQMGGTLSLGTQVIANDYLAAVFKSNALALVDLAQRQSVSNAQNRWATFKQAAWAILNAALPFLGSTVGTAAWIWQILEDLQQGLDATETGDRDQQKAVMTDLLLTLAMVLAHRGATLHTTARQIKEKPVGAVTTEIRQAVEPPPASIVQLPDRASDSATARHPISLLTGPALSLKETLDRFQISKPEPLTPPAADSGAYRHLYSHDNRYYTQVGERWFEVAVEENGEVSIIDARQQPPRQGPPLIGNSRGQWFVDTRLRLRGGGLSARRKAIKQQNAQRIAELKQQLAAFDDERANAKTELIAAYNQMKAASTEARPALQQQFLDLLEQRSSQYEAPIEQLKALSLLESLPNYRSAMTSMLDTQLYFNQSWLDENNATFSRTLRETLALLEAQETAAGVGDRTIYRQMIDLAEGVIGKIEFAHSRFQALSRLGRNAAEITNKYRRQLPAFSVNDLKALQVSLAREVCFEAGDSVALKEARGDFTRLLDTTNLAIQTSQELIQEDSAEGVIQRAEALDGVLEQFTGIIQAFEDLSLSHKDVLIQPSFEQVRKRVSEFHKDTEDHLAQLLRELPTTESRSVPSQPPRASRKRVIKTRFKGTVVGEMRPAAPGEPVLLEVRAPVTGKVIATFHEKTPGVWLERIPAPRRRPVAPAPALAVQLVQGQALLDGLEDFIRRTEAQSKKPGRIPVETEELFRQHAEHVGQSASALAQAMTPLSTIDGQNQTATRLQAALEKAKERLYAEGYRVRVDMIKQQPPTAARVEWLLSKGEIDIVRNGDRRRLKGPRKDFLQEYEIRERRGAATLWYAHFHYPRLDAAINAFTAAHLKTREQRLLAGAFDVRADTANPQLIAIYRSEISPQLARALFFSHA